MRLYRALLHLYPASFRAEYGAEMIAILQRALREADGTLASSRVWISAIGDVLINATRTHVDILQQDFRYAVRTLLRARGFAMTAILVASLGIGATTTAFSITDHVLLKPLPFPNSDRLVRLMQDETVRGYPRAELSPPNYRDWKRSSTSFEGMAAYTGRSGNLVGVGNPERLDGAAVTGGLFHVLGVQAALGRALTTIDDEANAPLTLVLSNAVWHGKFGGETSVLGRTVLLNDLPHTIVGVMPAGFEFPNREVDFWAPLRFSADNSDDERGNRYLQGVARLRNDVSVEQARSELRLIAAQLEREYPKANIHTSAAVDRLRDQVSQRTQTMLLTLVAASVCMLLIACTNLANLLLARGLARQKELAIRGALGAGRQRLTRQTLTESLVLAGCGGVFGIALAIVATPLVSRLVPHTMPIADVPDLDLRMLALAAAVTITTGIAFGSVAALRAARDIDNSALREGGRTGPSRRTERLRAVLVAAQVTASIVLLVSAGLLIRALWRVQQIDPGFRSENVLTLRTALPFPKYASVERRQEFYDRVVSEVRALPGVSSAAYISFLPMVMGGGIWAVTVEGGPQDPAQKHSASLRFVTPGFFETAGIPLLRGRDVSNSDTRDSPFVAVVSESFVRRNWPNQDPIGRRFSIGFRSRTVIGVVGNIRVRGLEREDSEPQVYVPTRQVPDGGMPFYAPKDLLIKASVPSLTLVAPVRDIIARADPQQPISDVRTLEDIVHSETAPRRAQVRVLAGFAAIAFVLAAVGIHGLLAFSVSSRTREIGVRIALGARASEIVGLVMRRGLSLAVIGIVLGIAIAIGAGRALQAGLAGVSPLDIPTFVIAVLLALIMTLAGTLLPALRAVRIDPLEAIRAE